MTIEIKKSFELVVKNPAVTLFFVLFLIITNFFAASILNAHKQGVTFALSICLLLTIAVFVSGWFQVIKEVVVCDNQDGSDKNLYAVFLDGAGKNLVSVIIGSIIYFLFFGLVLFLTHKFSLHFFGNLNFQDIPLMSDNKTLIEYFNNLSLDQKYALYGWQFCFIIFMGIFTFLSLFFFPALFFVKDKNIFTKPFSALKDCLVFTFKNFLNVFLIFILIHVSNFILALLNVLFAQNILLSLISLFIHIYFACFIIVLLFKYYEQHNCTNRTDCIGENSSCN